jgi:hypothetical protein
MQKHPFKINHAKAKATVVERVTDPAVWDNREWFYDQYCTMGRGVRIISRVLNKSMETVHSRLKRYGIPLRVNRWTSKHPCYSEAWLYFNDARRDQYVKWCIEHGQQPDPFGGKGLGLFDCAKIAKVVPYTIFNWLTHFNVPIRDARAASALNRRNDRSVLGQAQGQYTQGIAARTGA